MPVSNDVTECNMKILVEKSFQFYICNVYDKQLINPTAAKMYLVYYNSIVFNWPADKLYWNIEESILTG